MKIWTPAEDEHLLVMRNAPLPRIAHKFACTVEEVVQRRKELSRAGHDKLAGTSPDMDSAPKTAASNGEQPAQPSNRLPKGVTPEKIQAALYPIQRDFIEASAHYKALGAKLQELSDVIASALAEVELAEAILQANKAPRTSGETVEEKLARKLCEGYIVIPKPAP